MGRVREAVRSRWQVLYRRSSIQMILSLSFTAVAVVGMVFMGLTLFLPPTPSRRKTASGFCPR